MEQARERIGFVAPECSPYAEISSLEIEFTGTPAIEDEVLCGEKKFFPTPGFV